MLGVVALAGAAYLAAPLLPGGAAAYRTAEVTRVSVTVTAEAEGVVLREEQRLSSDDAYLLVTARDGERLAARGRIAIECLTAENYAAALGRPADGAAPSTAGEAVIALAEAVYGPAGSVDAALGALEARLSGGESAGQEPAEPPGNVIAAAEPGLFTLYADGLSGLAAEDCGTPRELSALLASPVPAAPEGAFGTLVTGVQWRFAALIDEEAASTLSAGDRAELTLPEGEFTARVESVSQPEGGERAVIFSCAERQELVADVRFAAAELLVTRSEGLFVPAEALHERGGEYYVLTEGPAGAEETAVTPVCEYGSGWLVESEALREGSEVLLPE